MRVLVTGGLGFVGVHVVRHLAVAGHEVTVLDREQPGDVHAAFLADVEGRLTHVTADLLGSDWELTVGAPDAVVHAAALTPLAPGEELRAVSASVSVNILATVRVLDFASARGVSRVVHLSSGSVYGAAPHGSGIHEGAPLEPKNVYGITKAAAEMLALRYNALGACDVVVARLAQPYGPMERTTSSRTALSPIHDWAVAALAGGPLIVEPGCLDRGRDYIFISDVAAAVVALTTAPSLDHTVFNISTGVNLTLRAVLECIVAQTGVSEIVTGPVNLPADAERPPLVPWRIEQSLAWSPAVDLDTGIAATLAWLRAGSGSARAIAGVRS